MRLGLVVGRKDVTEAGEEGESDGDVIRNDFDFCRRREADPFDVMNDRGCLRTGMADAV